MPAFKSQRAFHVYLLARRTSEESPVSGYRSASVPVQLGIRANSNMIAVLAVGWEAMTFPFH